jgi:hypothetical protein
VDEAGATSAGYSSPTMMPLDGAVMRQRSSHGVTGVCALIRAGFRVAVCRPCREHGHCSGKAQGVRGQDPGVRVQAPLALPAVSSSCSTGLTKLAGMPSYEALQTPPLNWRRATLCHAGECVEIAAHNGIFLMRSSTQRGSIHFAPDEFSDFLTRAKAGEFEPGKMPVRNWPVA